eukprot:4750156-Pyramimonas_sp.AAC.1
MSLFKGATLGSPVDWKGPLPTAGWLSLDYVTSSNTHMSRTQGPCGMRSFRGVPVPTTARAHAIPQGPTDRLMDAWARMLLRSVASGTETAPTAPAKSDQAPARSEA